MPYTWNIPQSKVVFQVRQFLSLDLPNIFSVCPQITGLPLCFSLFGSISSVLSSADFLLTHLFLRFLSDHRCFFLCEWVWIFCCPNLSQGQFHVSQYYGCAGVLDWNLFLKTLSIKQYINTRNKKIYTFLCLALSELFIFLNRSILEANYLHQIFCFPHTCEAYNKLISKLLLDYTLLCHQRRRNCFILNFSEVFLVFFYRQYFNYLNQNQVNDVCDFFNGKLFESQISSARLPLERTLDNFTFRIQQFNAILCELTNQANQKFKSTLDRNTQINLLRISMKKKKADY